MDSSELKKPYLRIAILISVAIIFAMYLTQSYWMNIGITTMYPEYNAKEILPNNNIPEGIFILSGNYSYISEWISTTNVNCSPNDDVKLLVYSIQEPGMKQFRNIVVMDAIEGCK
jgi:hypothetical protein